MFHINIIKDGDVTKVVKETLVDGQMYVDNEPTKGSTNPVTSDGVAKANEDIFDDGDNTGAEEEIHTAAAYNAYELNKYYVSSMDGKLYVCTKRERTGEAPNYTYNITLTKVNGVAAALNRIIDIINEQE